MEYKFTVSGVTARPCHSNSDLVDLWFPGAAQLLLSYVNGPLAQRLPGLRVSARRRRNKVFSLGQHASSLEPNLDLQVRVEELKTKALRLIEVSRLSVEYPIALMIPVSKGVEGKLGTSLFPLGQLESAVSLTVEHLRILQLQGIRRKVQRMVHLSIIEPDQIEIEEPQRRIASVLKQHRLGQSRLGRVVWKFPGLPPVDEEQKAKQIAARMVADWEKEEKIKLCQLLTFGAWWNFYVQNNKLVVEDTTVEQLVATLRSKLGAV